MAVLIVFCNYKVTPHFSDDQFKYTLLSYFHENAVLHFLTSEVVALELILFIL